MYEASPQGLRNRRQDDRIESRPTVLIYLGGGENSAMFNGCIKYPYLSQTGSSANKMLLANMQCGMDQTICGGRPVFNSCGAEQKNHFLQAVPKRSRTRKRKRKRPRPGNAPNPLVLSVEVLREIDAYASVCDLPYRPETIGYRYAGDGYSKYYVKRFNPSNWRFSLSMRTENKSGLIFFMSDTRCNEHIAVYLIKGKIAFSVMFGAERSRMKSSERYTDGDWHQLTFERKRNASQLMVDGSIVGQGAINSDSRFFPSNVPFYVGGLHTVQKTFASNVINQKNLEDFQGCIRDITLNNRLLDSEGSGLRINVSPCYQNGTETGIFFPYQEDGALPAYLVAMNSYDVANDMEVSVDIKPRSRTGIIFAVGGTTGNFFNLALVEGKVAARLRQGDETLFTRYDPNIYGTNLCDGQWHTIRVIKARNMIALTVDETLVTPIEEGSPENEYCRTNSALFVGGIPEGSDVAVGSLTDSQYIGCMKNMRIDFFPVNLNTVISAHGDITSNACPL